MRKIKEKFKKSLKSIAFFKEFDEKDAWIPEDNDGHSTCVDLGCGINKVKGCIGLDRAALPGVDIVCDINGKLPFDDNSIDIIYSHHVLPMLNDLEHIMGEIHRVLKKGTGKARIFVPHFSNPYGNYLYKNFYGYFTFDNFVRQDKQKSKRKVPDWYVNYHFEITSKKFIFTSEFLFFRIIAKIFQYFINKSDSLARFYEYHLCYIFPAYGIKVEMKAE